MNIEYIYKFLQEYNLFSLKYKLFSIKESTNNEIYKYNNYIIKISTDKDNLKYEYDVLKKLQGKGKFPKPVLYKKHNGFFVLVIYRKPGVGLQYLWKSMQLKNKKNVIQDIVKQIKIIHSIKITKSHYIQDRKKGLDCIMKKVIKNPYINLKKIESDYNRCLFLLDRISISDQCIIHNDIRYKNIILTKKGLSAIIDFENGFYGPRYLEYFRILYHKISAQNYLDSNPQEYIEMEFLDLLIEELKENYPKILDFTSLEWELSSTLGYIHSLARFDESRYNQKEIEKTFTDIMNFEFK